MFSYALPLLCFPKNFLPFADCVKSFNGRIDNHILFQADYGQVFDNGFYVHEITIHKRGLWNSLNDHFIMAHDNNTSLNNLDIQQI